MYAWPRIFLVATIAGLCRIVGGHVFVCGHVARHSRNGNLGSSTRSLSSGGNSFVDFGLGPLALLVSTGRV